LNSFAGDLKTFGEVLLDVIKLVFVDVVVIVAGDPFFLSCFSDDGLMMIFGEVFLPFESDDIVGSC
jgi:hypothetical protein